MPGDPLFILVIIAVVVVLVVLLVGIGSFGRGGKFDRKHANRLMRYRIYAQAVAIIVIVAYVLLRKMG